MTSTFTFDSLTLSLFINIAITSILGVMLNFLKMLIWHSPDLDSAQKVGLEKVQKITLYPVTQDVARTMVYQLVSQASPQHWVYCITSTMVWGQWTRFRVHQECHWCSIF
jgi:hypothetical protein